MTYRELLIQLLSLQDEKLNDDVTVYISDFDETFKIESSIFATEVESPNLTDVLDKGHFVLLTTSIKEHPTTITLQDEFDPN